ncbi:MAG TPA: hypothetical protein VHY35_09465 [Stellaceae bacterium]|jgi:hypothetical protein|nr:hypothetical protein [Stellaceae bacterium]
MRRRALLILALVAASLVQTARAQTTIVPAVPYYAMDPHSPLTPYANSPLQQQQLENYRSQLLQTQRQLSLRNPAGTNPTQLQVDRQLNSFAAPSPAPLGGTVSPAPGGMASLPR